MNILLWVVLGGAAGYLASIAMRSNASQGTIGDIVLGIIGAIAGGFIMNLFGAQGVNGFNLYSLFVAVLGSVVVIYLGRALSHR